jgi:ureidoglycolate hydrolase
MTVDAMDGLGLEVLKYAGTGYQPMIDFDSWRVAILRWEPQPQLERENVVERHTQTDEVFVLLQGRAVMFTAGKAAAAGALCGYTMAPGVLYNVKQNTWHTVILSSKASILIVENRNTGGENTEYCQLTPEQRRQISRFSI